MRFIWDIIATIVVSCIYVGLLRISNVDIPVHLIVAISVGLIMQLSCAILAYKKVDDKKKDKLFLVEIAIQTVLVIFVAAVSNDLLN